MKPPRNEMSQSIVAWGLSIVLVALGSTKLNAQLQANGATASFRGSLPPMPVKGGELSEDQIEALKKKLGEVTEDFKAVQNHERAADADIFLKAVRYAIEFREWYDKKPEDGIKKANALLDEASARIRAMKAKKINWLEGPGQKVVGFYSKIDNSPQPYGIEIPSDVKLEPSATKIPMWVWLHGRGDTSTDLHFIYSRLNAKKPGQFQPAGTMVIHPFGRYCNGWKSAGETDVLEARDDAIRRFPIDENRIALAGFSMGGAGAWHLGAHFADQWACVHAGAGFVDVKRYQKLTPEKMPNWFEQKLWGVYDVPNYARNFLNVPLVAYSGEKDKQRDAAEYMMEVLAKESLQPPHLIGPGVEHKYHPETIKEVQAKIQERVLSGRQSLPTKITLQTRTLAYSRLFWLEVLALEQHWQEARVDAHWDEAKNVVRIEATNVTSLAIHLPKQPQVTINGASVTVSPAPAPAKAWVWKADSTSTIEAKLAKRPGLQGPIDDAFKSSFLVVLPDQQLSQSPIDQWVELESKHFLVRWRSLMRGDVPVKAASQVTAKDLASSHVILWGTPTSNSLLKKFLANPIVASTISWSSDRLQIGSQSISPQTHVPVFCYPNPAAPNRYVVVNSGLTFREAHDRTNSLQNPKLPDWAFLDVSQAPNDEQAGKVVAADFFDEHWQPLTRKKSPSDQE
jgi:hypothetical protein